MPKRILLVKFWALGDLLMATPVLTGLRQLYPDCSISWLVDKDYAGVLAGNPLINQIISFDSGPWRRDYRNLRWRRFLTEALRMSRLLKAHKYDIVISFMPDKWWSLWFNQAKVRVGLFPSENAGWLGRFYTHIIPTTVGTELHNTNLYLKVLEPLGQVTDVDLRMICCPTETAKQRVMDLLGRSGLDDRIKFVAISPYSTSENRNWPDDRYRELANWIIDRYEATIVYIIGPRDRSRIDKLTRGVNPNSMIVLSDLNVEEYVALVASCDLVVSGDSSPMHISAATNVPYIALFGATPDHLRAPLSGVGMVLKKSLPCAPCDQNTCTNIEFRKCMNLITLDDVKSAVKLVLDSPTQ